MDFRIPYYYPGFNPGIQTVNLGQGGPRSHMALQAMQPRVYPTIYMAGLPGIGAMPRQVIGPTAPITANQFSRPDTVSHMLIRGLFKAPFGSQ